MVEFVIVFPVLLVLLLLGIQAALYYDGVQEADQVARQAVQAARSAGGGAQAGRAEADRVLAQLGPALLEAPRVSVTGDPAGSWTATVTGRAESVLAIIPLALHASASSPAEHFQVGP